MSNRWVKFVEVIPKSDPDYDPNMGSGLYCPNHHKLKDDFVLNESGFRCRHKASNGIEDCNKIVLVVAGGLRSVRNKPLYAVMEVSPQEMREMTSAGMKYWEMLEYLGMSYRKAA